MREKPFIFHKVSNNLVSPHPLHPINFFLRAEPDLFPPYVCILGDCKFIFVLFEQGSREKMLPLSTDVDRKNAFWAAVGTSNWLK